MQVDPVTQAALDLLKERYNVPAADIWGLTVESRHDDFTRMTVTLVIRAKQPAAAPTVNVPVLRPAIRQDTPRPASVDDPRWYEKQIAADKRSHAPTTCEAMLKVGDAAPYKCGELIRWDADHEGWVHASDHRLGPADHLALPGY